MMPILARYPKVRRYCSQCGSLLMLFQKSPIIQFLLPEAKLLGTVAAVDAVKLSIATV